MAPRWFLEEPAPAVIGSPNSAFVFDGVGGTSDQEGLGKVLPAPTTTTTQGPQVDPSARGWGLCPGWAVCPGDLVWTGAGNLVLLVLATRFREQIVSSTVFPEDPDYRHRHGVPSDAPTGVRIGVCVPAGPVEDWNSPTRDKFADEGMFGVVKSWWLYKDRVWWVWRRAAPTLPDVCGLEEQEPSRV